MTRPDSLGTHMSRWSTALVGRERWTREAWIDRLVASNKSWSQDDLEVFWGQSRDPSNYPIIQPVTEAVCGIEAQTRRDTIILARTRRHADTAEALTGLTKYINQQNKTARLRSQAFRRAATTDGVGWTEVHWSDDPHAEMIGKRAPDPMHMWIDPAGREDDLSDSIDIHRARWLPKRWVDLRWERTAREGMYGLRPQVDYDPTSHQDDWLGDGDDPAVGQFDRSGTGDPRMGPGHGMRAPLDMAGWATQDADTFMQPVDRYADLDLVVERWYRADEWAQFCRLRDGRVIEVTDETAHDVARLVLDGSGRLVRAVARRIRTACFVASEGGGLLHDTESPYPHGLFPFIPTWGYRDEEGQPFGLVRLLRDAAREFNMRRTSLTKRTLMRQFHYEEGAFVDEAQALREMAKFNGRVKYAEGKLLAGAAKVEDNGGASQSQMQGEAMLLDGAREMVQNLGPVTQEILGQQSDAKSGIAIQERKEGSYTALFTLFDNRTWAQQAEEEQTLALIQAGYTEEMEVRINGTAAGLQWLHINHVDPTTGAVLLQPAQGRFDVTVQEQPEAPHLRSMKLKEIAQLLQGAPLPPQAQLKLTRAMAEAQDLPEVVLGAIDEALEMTLAAAQMPQPGAPVDPNALPTAAPPPGLDPATLTPPPPPAGVPL